MTVAELCDRMSFEELKLWMVYDGFDPIGEERADLRNGMMMALLNNQQVDRNKHPERVKRPIDYMPFAEKPKFENDLDKSLHEAFMSLGARTVKPKASPPTTEEE